MNRAQDLLLSAEELELAGESTSEGLSFFIELTVFILVPAFSMLWNLKAEGYRTRISQKSYATASVLFRVFSCLSPLSLSGFIAFWVSSIRLLSSNTTERFLSFVWRSSFRNIPNLFSASHHAKALEEPSLWPEGNQKSWNLPIQIAKLNRQQPSSNSYASFIPISSSTWVWANLHLLAL